MLTVKLVISSFAHKVMNNALFSFCFSHDDFRIVHQQSILGCKPFTTRCLRTHSSADWIHTASVFTGGRSLHCLGNPAPLRGMRLPQHHRLLPSTIGVLGLKPWLLLHLLPMASCQSSALPQALLGLKPQRIHLAPTCVEPAS